MSETANTVVTEAPERESGRHPVNVGHLVMGIALLGLLAVWALVVSDVVGGDDVRWLLPAPWVLAGAAGLITLAATGHRGHAKRQVGWVAPPAPPAPQDDIETETETEPQSETAAEPEPESEPETETQEKE
jgi:hypothetical protein